MYGKKYNNSIIGESCYYPEFKGYHAALYWVVNENKESSFIKKKEENIFLRMQQPLKRVETNNNKVSIAFAEGII